MTFRWLRDRANRGVVAALLVGFGLRLAWAVVATHTPIRLSDAWHYQNIATSFSFHATEMIGANATAFYPPGWPMALAPLAWLSRRTGIMSLSMAASLLNVVAGTATVALVAALARLWIGVRARLVAAWVMALAPAHIFLGSTSFSETWFTATALVALFLATVGARAGWSSVRWGTVGLVVGYATLVRTPGVLFLAAVPLAVRAVTGRRRPGLRPVLAATVGATVVLVPWTVRNGMQVGVWTPTSTNNVAFLCLGNRDGATGGNDPDPFGGVECFRRSPMDDASAYRPGDLPPSIVLSGADEPAWYSATLRRAVRWAIDHPGDQPRLVTGRLAATFNGDNEALSDAEGFGQRPVVGTVARDAFNLLAKGWLWGLLALGPLALILVRRCRAALPVWGLAAIQLAPIVVGIGLQRYHHAIMPLLAILAAGLVRERLDAPDVVADEPDGASATVGSAEPGGDPSATDGPVDDDGPADDDGPGAG